MFIPKVAPNTCSPMREKKGTEVVNGWKQCPSYGTFSGKADEDHNCCINASTCALNATDIDSDLEQLVFRTKRDAGKAACNI